MLAGALASALGGSLAVSAWWGRRRALVLGGITLVAALSLMVRPNPEVWWRWVIVVAAMALLGSSRRWRPVAMSVLLVAAAVDLITWAKPQLPRAPAEWFYPRTSVIDVLAEASATLIPSRVVGEGRALYPHHLAIHGLEDLRGHDPLGRADLGRVLGSVFGFSPSAENYFASFLEVTHPFLDALNVSTIAVAQLSDERPGLVRRGAGGRHTVWSNPGVLPRWFIASRAEVVPPEDLPAWLRALTDPRVVAIDPGAKLPDRLEGTPTRVESLGVRAPGFERLAIDPVAQPRLLATSLPWPEGWTAQADGRKLRSVVVNGAFFGAELPPQVSRVEFRFRPPGLITGLVLGVLSWLVALGLWWRRER